MKEIVTVQKGTIDEWPIACFVNGNTKDPDMMVIFAHGGGMDHKEQGTYALYDLDGKPVKKEITLPDGTKKMKTVIFTLAEGNFDVLSREASDMGLLSIAYDMRNHGESLRDGDVDTRTTLVSRNTKDLDSIINYYSEKYNNPKIMLVGSCFGALTIEAYVGGEFIDSEHPMEHRDDVDSCALISPLNPEALAGKSKDKELNDILYNFGFNKKKHETIDRGEDFSLMKGMYEGKRTEDEMDQHVDLSLNFAKEADERKINILGMYAINDRFIPIECARKYANIIKENASKSEFVEYERGGHCFYEPKESKAIQELITDFMGERVKSFSSKTK